MGLCATEFKNLSDKERKQYEAIAEKDKARYEKELAHLVKHGYFVNAEGQNSSEIEKKVKKQKAKDAKETEVPPEKIEKAKRKKED
jgi:hypothetical protein